MSLPSNSPIWTTRRLLTIFAPTLETLEVGYFDGTTGSILQGVLIELRKLSTFTLKYHEYGTDQAILDTFKRYTSITTLHILFRDNHPNRSFHHADLPAVRRLTCDHHLWKDSWSYGPITALSYLSLSTVLVISGVHWQYLGFIWFTILNLSTAHPSLHRSLVIHRSK